MFRPLQLYYYDNALKGLVSGLPELSLTQKRYWKNCLLTAKEGGSPGEPIGGMQGFKVSGEWLLWSLNELRLDWPQKALSLRAARQLAYAALIGVEGRAVYTVERPTDADKRVFEVVHGRFQELVDTLEAERDRKMAHETLVDEQDYLTHQTRVARYSMWAAVFSAFTAVVALAVSILQYLSGRQ